MNLPNFGRRPSPDPKDSLFSMRRLLAPAGESRPTVKTWRIAPASLDQRDTGTCVGHAWKNFLRCAPIQTNKGVSPWDIYRSAVLLDEWSGNDVEANFPDYDSRLDDGTSVRAGAQVLSISHNLQSYVWAFSVQSAIEWVLTKGPVVMGTNWYSSMMNPDADGIVKITQQANNIGGHAYLLRGVDTRKSLAICENSWGELWGKGGGFYLPLNDLERLLHEDGEACSAVEQKLKKTTIAFNKSA